MDEDTFESVDDVFPVDVREFFSQGFDVGDYHHTTWSVLCIFDWFASLMFFYGLLINSIKRPFCVATMCQRYSILCSSSFLSSSPVTMFSILSINVLITPSFRCKGYRRCDWKPKCWYRWVSLRYTRSFTEVSSFQTRSYLRRTLSLVLHFIGKFDTPTRVYLVQIFSVRFFWRSLALHLHIAAKALAWDRAVL